LRDDAEGELRVLEVAVAREFEIGNGDDVVELRVGRVGDDEFVVAVALG
jgi:hypothetical protein